MCRLHSAALWFAFGGSGPMSSPSASCMKADSASPFWLSFAVQLPHRSTLAQHCASVCTHWQWQFNLPAGKWVWILEGKQSVVSYLWSLKGEYSKWFLSLWKLSISGCLFQASSQIMPKGVFWGERKRFLDTLQVQKFLPRWSTNFATWRKQKHGQEFKFKFYITSIHVYWAIGV